LLFRPPTVETTNLWFLTVGGSGLLFVFLALTTATEAAVTQRHVIWNGNAPIFGRLFGDDSGTLPLGSVDSVDVEEGGSAITLHCGGESHRLGEIAGGQVEEMALAIGRPARIWRACKSPAAKRARRWRMPLVVIEWGFSGAACGGTTVWVVRSIREADYSLPEVALIFLAAFAAIIIAATIISTWLHKAASALPYLLAGRFLTGDERRDFVCTLTDLRWNGVNPDGPGTQRVPQRSRIRDWAMRKAYGEIPDYPAWEPEVIEQGSDPNKPETREE
jgi:hypothetical protein